MVKVDEPSYDSKEYLFYTGRQTFKSPELQLPDDYSRKCWFGKLQQYFCRNLSIFYYPLYKDNPRVEGIQKFFQILMLCQNNQHCPSFQLFFLVCFSFFLESFLD